MWMVSEFFKVDDKVKPYCLIPFGLGLLVLLYYYLIYSPLQKRKETTAPVPASKQVAVEEVS
jgi:hypothetical protein